MAPGNSDTSPGPVIAVATLSCVPVNICACMPGLLGVQNPSRSTLLPGHPGKHGETIQCMHAEADDGQSSAEPDCLLGAATTRTVLMALPNSTLHLMSRRFISCSMPIFTLTSRLPHSPARSETERIASSTCSGVVYTSGARDHRPDARGCGRVSVSTACARVMCKVIRGWPRWTGSR